MKVHPASLSRRIKKGMKKSVKTGNNPHFQEAVLSGIFPPANIPALVKQYKAMSPAERTFVKTMVMALTAPVGGIASPVAGVTLKALDLTV